MTADNDGYPSATEIIPALQHVAPGDVLPSLPGVKESFVRSFDVAAPDLGF